MNQPYHDQNKSAIYCAKVELFFKNTVLSGIFLTSNPLISTYMKVHGMTIDIMKTKISDSEFFRSPAPSENCISEQYLMKSMSNLSFVTDFGHMIDVTGSLIIRNENIDQNVELE